MACVFFAGFSALSSGTASATNPALISFQGKVVNANGTNVTNGSYNFDFIMYSDPTLGSPSDGVYDKWHELTKSVTVTNGVFQTNLGSATALPDFNANPSLYLAVRFNADAAGYMSPRVQMGSVPYALNADKVGGVAASALGQLAANQTWTGTQTFQPTTNIISAIIKQTSIGSPTADIFNIQTANATSILQVTGPVANEASVLLNSVGATRALTLDSGSGTIILGSNTTTLQKSGTALTIDINSGSSSTLTVTNAGAGVANLAVEGNITTSATIGTASTTTFTGAGATFSGNVSIGANSYLNLVGGATGSRPGSPTDGMVFYDTSTKQLITYDSTLAKWKSNHSASSKIVAASNSSQAAKDAADYVATGTADDVVINAALTALSTSGPGGTNIGGTVYLAEGTYSILDTIFVYDNMTLAGAGQGTKLELATQVGIAENLIENQNVTTGTGVVIQDMVLDGKKSLNTSGTQRGIYFDNMGDTTSPRNGGTIRNVTLRDFRENGIYLIASDNNTITGNTTIANNLYGTYFNSSYSNVYSNNLSLEAGGVVLQVNSSNNTIADSTFTNPTTGNAITVEFGALSNIINGNTVTGYLDAIYLNNNSGGGNVISGNTVKNAGRYGISTNGINNLITGNTVTGSVTSGIYIVNNDNIVTNNRIHDSGGATANNGILIPAFGSSGGVISGNNITDTSCTTSCNAIVIPSTHSNLALGNNTYSGPSSAYPATISDASTSTIYTGQLTPASVLQSSATTIIAPTSKTSPGTGSISSASTTVNGTSTKFLTDIKSGDRVTINAETRYVRVISSNTQLDTDSAFTTTASGQTITILRSPLTVIGSTGVTDLVVRDDGALDIWNGVLGIGRSLQQGSLIISDGSSNTVTLTASGIGTNYSLTLPTAAGSTSQCLQTDSVTVSQLVFASCSAGGSLQAGYTASTGSTTPEIILDTTRNGLDIQDKTGGTIGATQGLLNVRGVATATTLGASLFTVNGTGQVAIKNGGTTATPTISYDLSFGQNSTPTGRTIGIEDQATAATAGNALTVSSGKGNTTGAGGLLSISGGAGGASGDGGGINIKPGSSGATTGAGGILNLQGGTGTASGAAGGTVNILGGTSGSTGTASAINITAGAAVGSTVAGGGRINITSGDGANSDAGGLLTVKGGAGGATGAGGGIALVTGIGGATSGNSGALTLQSGNVTSGTAGNINIDVGTSTSGNGSITIGTAARAQTVTVGSATGASATTIQSGSGNINLSPSAGNDVVFSQAAGSNLQLNASAAPTVDQLAISNSGQANTTAGVNGLSINYVGGAAAVESAAAKIDLTPGTTTGGTWSGVRVVANATGPVSGVTEYGIKLEGPSTQGSGTETGVYIDNKWDIGLDIQSGGLNLAAISDPPTPAADNLRVYAKKVSGRMLLKGIGASGVDYAYQPALFQQAISYQSPLTGATVSSVGQTWTVDTTGSTPAATETFGVSTNFATAATANDTAGVAESLVGHYRGSVAGGSNGFFYVVRVGLPDASYGSGATGARIWVGLSNQTIATAVGNDNPAGHYVGFQYSTNRGASTWMFVTKDNTTQSTPAAATGITFAQNKVYDFYIYVAPQGTTIYWRVDNLTDGQTVEGNTTTNLPGTSTAMRAGAEIQTLTTTARNIRVLKQYVEADR
ncbi:hypothetical protein BH10PAT3_BH10PAT3_3070 [soil metagenome]